MGMIDTSKESWAAQDYIKQAKGAFAEKFERNVVQDVDVVSCVLDESYTDAVRFQIVGSVETTSPTGKSKTYGYHATVDVTGKQCALAALSVDPLKE